MKKLWVIVTIAILLLIIGITAGIYTYQKNNTQDSNIKRNDQLAMKNEQENNQITNNIISTSSVEERVSPDCILIEKRYFNGCDHLIRDMNEVPNELINCSKEQLQEEYKDWKVEEFSSSQVSIYQENNGFCDKHYLIKEHR